MPGGLKFSCNRCGSCCRTRTARRWLYLGGDDIRRASRALDISPGEFIARHTRKLDGFRVLEAIEGSCPFLENDRCAIHSSRPAQCRAFPFWRSLLENPGTWEEAAGRCPGIGTGSLHTLPVIDETANNLEALLA